MRLRFMPGGISAKRIPDGTDSRQQIADSRRTAATVLLLLSVICYPLSAVFIQNKYNPRLVCRLQFWSVRGERLGVTAIIAAYNEENTIADVLAILTRNQIISEVIVVS